MATKAELEERNALLQETLEEAFDLIHDALGITDVEGSDDDES